MVYLLQLLERAWMSFVHNVRGIGSCPEGLILLRRMSFKLEDVAWENQGFGDIIYALSKEALRCGRGSGRMGGVFKHLHGSGSGEGRSP